VDRYVSANRTLWDEWAEVNARSEFYRVEQFKQGVSRLRDYELREVGPVGGRALLHLQCHFGLDTLRLARLGAEVTGVDFSGEAVRAATALAAEVGLASRFVEGDVLSLDLGERFDVVFASWGALCWLPRIDRWAATVARHVEPGGRVVVVDQHSFLWAWDDEGECTPWTPRYEYFRGGAPFSVLERGTYADLSADIELPEHVWNNTPPEVATALAGEGLRLERLLEHPVIPWPALPWLVQDDERFWRNPSIDLPLSYTLVAVADN
jgi:SAM-dependent methyltransferase